MFLTNQYTDLRKAFFGQLKSYYEDPEIRTLFKRVMEHLTGIPFHVLHAQPERRFSESILRDLGHAVSELQQYKPWQYITGQAPFLDLLLQVDHNVLIPRPETEELTKLVLGILRERIRAANHSLHVLDACTGSGCIALAIKSAFPDISVHAFDVSSLAVEGARRNAKALNLDVDFFQADIFEHPAVLPAMDIFVSNPPYVTHAEKEKMHPNVLMHEPHDALFVPDDTPLRFYVALINWGKQVLKPGGLMCMEINESFGDQVMGLLSGAGFDSVRVAKDFRDRDRFVFSRMPC